MELRFDSSGIVGWDDAGMVRMAETTDQQVRTVPGLEVKGVSKRFAKGSVVAYEGVGFSVEAGSFVSLIGPSGCGKSTLLKSLAGLVLPDEGSICWRMPDGREVKGPETGYIFQDATLLPWFSVRKNVEVPLRLRGTPHGQREEICAEMIRRVWLEGFEESYPKALSGGMRMRVSLARALTLDPQVMMMDEPFGALDALTRNEMNRLLIGLWQRQRWTTFLVTHSVNEAVMLSDRILVMSARPGRILADVRVDLPRPRDEEMTGDPVYRACVAEVRAHIAPVMPMLSP